MKIQLSRFTIIRKLLDRIYTFYRRKQSKKTIYNYVSTNDGWIKYGAKVVDSNDDLFDPYRCIGAAKLISVSNRTKNSIEIYDISNPFHLKKYITALTSGGQDKWDEKVNRAMVMKKNNKWLMWYTGQNGKNSSIGLAVSEDGSSYTRYSYNPILIAEEKYEKNSVMNPCVIWDDDENLFKMWYSAGDQFEPDVICYATSQDGIDWVKHKENPIFTKGEDLYDRMKVGGGEIIKDNEKYTLYYIGYETLDNARICCAYSRDGVTNWERSLNNPLISPSKGQWDSDAVYKPCVIQTNQGLLMFYNARKRNYETIGVAYKK